MAKMLSAGLLDDEHVRPVVDRLIAIDRECNDQRANLDGLSGRLTRDATHHPFFGRVSGKE